MNEDIRALFPITERYIYLNHAAVSPLSKPARDAMLGLIEDVSLNGTVHYDDWLETYERVRAAAARLIGARPREVAFMRNTSDAISAIANGIDWREGDNVVTCDVEFPANIYPWMRLAERGVHLKMARERNGRIELDELISLMDERTRVLAISWVQFASGFRSDLRRLGQACRERGVIFAVDAIQGLGALDLDVERDFVDALAADAHKYLLGPEGIALLYISDRIIEKIRPVVVGWTSVKNPMDFLNYRLEYRDGAARFECGTLNTVGVYGLGAAIELLLKVGTREIEDYLLGLNAYLMERLEQKGYEIISSRRPSERSAIVACRHRAHPPGELCRMLLSKGIVTSARAGRLRISPHFYNTREEIDALIEALPD